MRTPSEYKQKTDNGTEVLFFTGSDFQRFVTIPKFVGSSFHGFKASLYSHQFKYMVYARSNFCAHQLWKLETITVYLVIVNSQIQYKNSCMRIFVSNFQSAHIREVIQVKDMVRTKLNLEFLGILDNDPLSWFSRIYNTCIPSKFCMKYSQSVYIVFHLISNQLYICNGTRIFKSQ